MPAQKHPDYKAEKLHLKKTIGWIETEREVLSSYEEVLREEISQVRKSVTHLMDDQLLLKQQLYLTTQKSKNDLTKIKGNPYFGRIDFQEESHAEIETIYIGKHGLHDQEQESAIVIDWRSPVADIYYSGHSKDVSYRSPAGIIHGTMHVKRRYEISNEELEEIYDEKTSESIIEDSLTAKDDFLLGALGKSTAGRLKEIVATIQDEQNQIIRSEMLTPLVVQGVAGSGKTTIALHRMAYLIYNNRRNTDANYMVVAPNKLFLHYISDILPDLGVDHVFQTTFEEWALSLLRFPIHLHQKTDKLNQLMEDPAESIRILSRISKLKGSLLLKKIIDFHLQRYEKALLPAEDMTLEGIVLLEYKELYQIFTTSNLHLSTHEKINRLNTYLKTRLKKDWPKIEENIEGQYQVFIQNLKSSTSDQESIRDQIIHLYNKREEIIQRVKKQLPFLVDAYTKKMHAIDPLQFYKNVFTDVDTLKKAFHERLSQSDIEQISQNILLHLEANHFDNEDLASLVYIHIRLLGLESKNKYSHIVIDEAQDLDEFQLTVLREISLNDSFTLVGDLSQGIYGYKGIQNWKKTMERVFKGISYHYYTVTTSYRSTVEIVNLSNGVIKLCKGLDPVAAQPIFRHGDIPSIQKCNDPAHMYACIEKDLSLLQGESMSSIAIICKTLKASEKLFQVMGQSIPDLQLITDQEAVFHGGVIVIPSYLSKGLEFDAVIIADVDEETYSSSPLDIKLLYVTITRALHRVLMYYHGVLTPVLQSLEDFYRMQ